MTTPLKLFISYRSTDSGKVDTIVHRLRSRKLGEGDIPYQVWQDKSGIPAGQDWWQTILDAIDDSNIFIFCLSKASLASDICKAELKYAYERNFPIIPVVLEGEHEFDTTKGKNDLKAGIATPSELDDFRTQYLFYEGTSFFQQLHAAIEAFQKKSATWKLTFASRPPNPVKSENGEDDASTIYNKARDLADHLEFEESLRRFRRLMRLNDPNFGSEAYDWITILGKYKELTEMDASPHTQHKLAERWNEYKKAFETSSLKALYKDSLFDPKDFANRDFRLPPPTTPAVVPVVAAPPVAVAPAPAPLPPMTEKEAFDAVIAFLVPLMGRGSDRQATVEAALLDCRVLQQINWEGPAQTFTIHLVMTLRKFGHCSKDNPAIVMLLRAMKGNVGDDQYPMVDRLIAHYNAPRS